jgi:hypothetical protein
MGVEDLLNFAWEEFLAAAIDCFLAATGKLHVAALVDKAPEIASAEPTVFSERCGISGGIVVVAEMNAGAACGNLADFTTRNIAAAGGLTE